MDSAGPSMCYVLVNAPFKRIIVLQNGSKKGILCTGNTEIWIASAGGV
jgi:hypothetical protein